MTLPRYDTTSIPRSVRGYEYTLVDAPGVKDYYDLLCRTWKFGSTEKEPLWVKVGSFRTETLGRQVLAMLRQHEEDNKPNQEGE